MTNTHFVRLPYKLLQPIEGGCQCAYCTKHPHSAPQWDTLAFDDTGHSWTVHMPDREELENYRAEMRDKIARRNK